MRFILADWGTSRFRAFVVDDGRIVDRVSSDEGISALREGQHRDVFLKHCRPWLEREPDAPVALVGMVGSKEGWRMAPYAQCPAGPEEIARAMIEVEIGEGRKGRIVPGLSCEPQAGAVDVMRGEETLCLGAGVIDGLVCLPGTHPKWVEMKHGRVARFATYFTGEMYALLRHHSMVGRPATEPEDPAGFERGLEAAERNSGRSGARVGLLHLIFGARAAAVTGRLPSAELGPYISGLLTGDEINGAFGLFDKPREVTAIGAEERVALFGRALARHGIAVVTKDPEEALVAGIARILEKRSI
ncbi:MAG: 2-keto-3-deoxy-galactonokinase [Microvirga sp.]|jgi:2-dehydro-3-deoxygalactonokinase|nr:2-keto-3-deoxy-galactonokinase [Microvirga sp.]